MRYQKGLFEFSESHIHVDIWLRVKVVFTSSYITAGLELAAKLETAELIEPEFYILVLLAIRHSVLIIKIGPKFLQQQNGGLPFSFFHYNPRQISRKRR